MRHRKVILGFCIGAAIVPAGAGAQVANLPPSHCPWLNVATASGALNGAATLTMQQPSADETVCVFRSQYQKAVHSLQIEVWAHQDVTRGLKPQETDCSAPGMPVQAIGNEAVLCAEDRKAAIGDAVIGRVRDSIFRVSISTTDRNDPNLPRDVLEQKTRDTAEAVAGSMF